MFERLLHWARRALDPLSEVLRLASFLLPVGPARSPLYGREKAGGMVSINGEKGTDGRSVERGKIGEREATGFQNICNVSVHNSSATRDQSQFKAAEASKNKETRLPTGGMYSLGYEHKHALTHFLKCHKRTIKEIRHFEKPNAIIIVL